MELGELTAPEYRTDGALQLENGQQSYISRALLPVSYLAIA